MTDEAPDIDALHAALRDGLRQAERDMDDAVAAFKAAQAAEYDADLWQRAVDTAAALLRTLGEVQRPAGALRALGAREIWQGESLTLAQLGQRMSTSRQRASLILETAQKALAGVAGAEQREDSDG